MRLFTLILRDIPNFQKALTCDLSDQWVLYKSAPQEDFKQEQMLKIFKGTYRIVPILQKNVFNSLFKKY